MRLRQWVRRLVIVNGVVIAGALLAGLLLGLSPEIVLGQTADSSSAGVTQWGFLSAALSVGIGALGAGIAVGLVGAAAMGTIGERPELIGRALIFVGLAEGIAIYGLVIAIIILGRI